ncbi:metallophosphoesterase [Candidatus Woesearchaeota archaeon]|nr:metallophosphoesterase [Candidatus Woesearchaeota archaeon]MBT4111070.1 metallophosphoesterase [Candidatus Woesearchaeota archaeon]MBT4336939.1 metallophosphoesterase [Candidatus Woesearchaeota archaeon]MBT4469746.1 metallophosphoesterase [Candidatus Woesearchaeota archaeon]MBT6743783.1 metallophosphoesterase [Candidatus Woesearchaeota archaeon]
MQILDNIEIVDLALWIKDKQILIISDVHLGLEESLHLKGILIPKQQSNLIIDSLKNILSKVQPRTIIINGDLKHNFGKNLKQEWEDTFKLIDFLKQNCEELIFIKGNHDNFLKTIANQKDIKVVDELIVGNILLLHGDKLREINKDIKTIIIGHEHPAISLKEKSKMEKFKCFLKGKYKNKELIVMPSFNPLSYGSDILNKSRFSPFLKDISKFEVFIVGDEEVFKFGKVKAINRSFSV